MLRPGIGNYALVLDRVNQLPWRAGAFYRRLAAPRAECRSKAQRADMGQARLRQDEHEIGEGPVLDLIHLQSMTLGDDRLARELLDLFDTQAALLSERMQQCESAALATLAHTLRGSAVGIGAVQVAQAAQAVERAPNAAARVKAVLRLTQAVALARASIAEVLRG
jgi:HPt (histidine-containing phosphotransfer) domain-containing protein